MDRHNVDEVAQLTSSSGCHHLVSREMNGVENVAKDLILDGGKESEIAIDDPFQSGAFFAFSNGCGVDCREPAKPTNVVPG